MTVELPLCTVKNNLTCQLVKLRNQHNFVASPRFDNHDDQKLIQHADFLIHHRNLADATGSVRISKLYMNTCRISFYSECTSVSMQSVQVVGFKQSAAAKDMRSRDTAEQEDRGLADDSDTAGLLVLNVKQVKVIQRAWALW